MRQKLGSSIRSYATDRSGFLAAPIAVFAVLTCRRQASRGQVVFYLAIAMLYFILSLGPGTILFDLYLRLPLGSAFRDAGRLLWVTNFAIAVLVGLGAEAILRPETKQSLWPQRASITSLLVLNLVLRGLAAKGLRWPDWLLTTALFAAVAMCPPRLASLSRTALPVLVFVNGAAFGTPPLQGLRPGELYQRAAPAFAFVSKRLTPEDRIFIVGRHGGSSPDFALIPKSASIFRLPSIFDYEPQVSRSYAEFFTFMRTGRTMQKLRDWYWIFGKLMPPTVQRSLLDLTAARYLLVDRELDRTNQVLKTGIRLLTENGDVRVYENQQALPRAFYVPRVRVTPEDRILEQLASGSADPRRVGLVSRVPRSGFLGSEADASGSAQVVFDGSERVVVRVRATAPGFLFLADQYFPGWTARVNGREREILRGNYTFRLVEVPAGESEVVFTYRPLSFRLGAAISLATFVAIVVYWVGSRRVRVIA